ncbi:unnamed protein product [Brassicogethes aeneus]|uniref:Odorant receptor n=1 Tax=Brassicogethes aeneus TaxID=1431903 RepID=A0A9P0BBQ4_BRAAE|nr:unnamed protein product [Brassicogethes aeneus]
MRYKSISAPRVFRNSFTLCKLHGSAKEERGEGGVENTHFPAFHYITPAEPFWISLIALLPLPIEYDSSASSASLFSSAITYAYTSSSRTASQRCLLLLFPADRSEGSEQFQAAANFPLITFLHLAGRLVAGHSCRRHVRLECPAIVAVSLYICNAGSRRGGVGRTQVRVYKVKLQEISSDCSKMSSALFKNYFDLTMKNVYLSGLWFKHYQKSKHKIYWAIHCPIVISCAIYMTYFEIKSVAQSRELTELIKHSRDHLNHVAGTAKLVAFIFMRKQFYEIFRILKSYDFSYEDYPGFDCTKIVKNQLKTCHNWIKLFYTLMYIIAVSIWIGEHYKIFTTYSVVHDFGTVWKMVVVLNFSVIGLISLGWITLGFDVIFTTMCSCITAHIKILQGAFRTIRPRCLMRLNLSNQNYLHDPEELQKETMEEMKRCIKHLQAIIEASEKVEYVYNKQALVQTMISLLEICFSLYLSSIGDEDIAMNVSYLLATLFQLLIYCWHGNELTLALGLPIGILETAAGGSGGHSVRLLLFGGRPCVMPPPPRRRPLDSARIQIFDLLGDRRCISGADVRSKKSVNEKSSSLFWAVYFAENVLNLHYIQSGVEEPLRIEIRRLYINNHKFLTIPQYT